MSRTAAIINFPSSKALRTEGLPRKIKFKERLTSFQIAAHSKMLNGLRKAAIPESEFEGSLCFPSGQWVAEVRYDHLLHEGEGHTEAAALVDAVLKIIGATAGTADQVK